LSPELVKALVPFGIAGLAIVAVLMIAMFPRNGRTDILIGAIAVVCAIFAYDRYLQNASNEKLNSIMAEVRLIDREAALKLSLETRSQIPLADLKAATERICTGIRTIYRIAQYSVLPNETCRTEAR
jgi:hypothetical protein